MSDTDNLYHFMYAIGMKGIFKVVKKRKLFLRIYQIFNSSVVEHLQNVLKGSTEPLIYSRLKLGIDISRARVKHV